MFKADLVGKEGSSAEYACLPSKYSPTKDSAGPRRLGQVNAHRAPRTNSHKSYGKADDTSYIYKRCVHEAHKLTGTTTIELNIIQRPITNCHPKS